MIKVNVLRTKAFLFRLLKRALAGKQTAVAVDGAPAAQQQRVQEAMARRPGVARGRVTDTFFEPLPKDELLD